MMKTNLLPPFFSAAQKVTVNALRKPFQKYLLAAFLMLSSVGVWGQIAAWNFNGILSSTNVVSYASTTFDANLVTMSNANHITRGLNATWSGAKDSFRTTGFKNDGISTANSDYFQTTLTAKTGYKLSLSNINAIFNGTNTFYSLPGVTSQFAYSLDGSTFTLIGSPSISTTLTLPQIDLSGISALQNVAAGTTVTIRYYASGQTTTGGWGFYSSTSSNNGLSFGGTVELAVADTTAPTIFSLSPLDDATDVGVNSNLVMTFDENVKRGTAGDIVIYNGNGTVFETIPYNDSRITYSGKTATINPAGTFANSADYYVQIANTAIADTAGNAYAGINDTTSWNFTTVAITYSVTVTQATGGTITPGTQTGITSGSSSSAFTATPTSCYTFASWTIDGTPNASTVNPYTFTNVNANHTLTAVYTLKTYNVTASAGANGSVSPNGPTAVNCGASQTYTISPNSGYAVDDVLVDGVSVGAVTTYLFTNVTAAHTIAATFKLYVEPCGSETFTNIPSDATNAGSYADRTWTGDNGGTWNATLARTDQTLNGKAIVTSGSGKVTSPIYPNGISVLSFNYVRAFTGTKDRSIEVYVNGIKIGNTITVNATSNTVTNYSETINVSGDVQLELKTSGAQIMIDDISWTCNSTSGNTSPTDYFRSKQIGSWTAVSSWESSHNGSTGWVDADLSPTSNATSITIRNGHQVTIDRGGVSMTNTTVEAGGILEVTTTSSFDLSGNGSGRNIQLTIKNNGQFLVNSPSNYNRPTGNASGVIETGGKLIAGPNMGSVNSTNTGSVFSDAYLGKNNGIFYFGDAAICEWACPHTTLGSSTPTDSDFFFPYEPTDMPIFRVTTSPAFEFGSATTNNIFNSILEVISPAVFQIGKGASSGSSGTKRFIGGVRGTGTVTQNASPTGNIFLGDGTHVPVIDGSITLNIQDNRLKLPNGANVPLGANATIKSAALNSSFDRQGGNVTIDGILDITNMRIINTTTGGISVKNFGTLKTAHTGGLYGTGAAIASGTLNLDLGSTINYSADVNQKISTGKDYYNIIFSGSGGTKSPSTATSINVHTDGKVTITGSPTVNFAANNLASTSLNNTKFDMDGGRLILGTAELLPNMKGTYNITGGTIEFTANASGIRTPNMYHNVEITVPANKEVSYSGGNLTLNSGASVLVKPNATLTSTSGNASLVGTAGNMLTVESGATFKTAVTSGFYGPVGLPNLSPSVRNNLALDLQPGSTVEYSRLSGAFGTPANALSGDQIVTPLPTGYQKLQISGDGIKTARGEIRVKEMTTVASASSTLLVPPYDEITNPVYSVFYALGGINNDNGMSGNFILGNDAQLMQNATAVNTAAKIEVNRNLILTSDRKEYNYLISPVEGQDMKSIIGNNPTNIQFITKINEATSLFVNAGVGPYVKGLAYAVKETIPEYDDPGFDLAKFKGKPFNDDFDFQLYKTAANRGYNLSGNPYPSNLDLDKLYTDSSNIESTFRFWDNKANNIYVQQGGGYQGYSYAYYNAPNGTGVAAPGGNGKSATGTEPNHILKVGQGFMIRVDPGAASVPLPGTAGTLVFKNSQRIVDQTNAPFFGRNSTSTTKDRYWLEYVTPSNLVISSAVVYFPEGTNLFSADDTRFPGSSDALYSMAEQTKVIINGRSPFEVTDIINLGTKAFIAGNYKIRIGKKEGVFDNGQAIYLKDKQLGILTDISQQSYSFTSEAGEFANRFEIVYQSEVVLGAGDSNRKAKIQIYRVAEDFVIQSLDKKIISYELYDMSGRIIKTQKTNAKEIHFNAEGLVDGTYVVKIQVEEAEVFSRKIRK